MQPAFPTPPLTPFTYHPTLKIDNGTLLAKTTLDFDVCFHLYPSYSAKYKHTTTRTYVPTLVLSTMGFRPGISAPIHPLPQARQEGWIGSTRGWVTKDYPGGKGWCIRGWVLLSGGQG
eukprot:749442-Hanusia_phi.AAC.4